MTKRTPTKRKRTVEPELTVRYRRYKDGDGTWRWDAELVDADGVAQRGVAGAPSKGHARKAIEAKQTPT